MSKMLSVRLEEKEVAQIKEYGGITKFVRDKLKIVDEVGFVVVSNKIDRILEKLEELRAGGVVMTSTPQMKRVSSELGGMNDNMRDILNGGTKVHHVKEEEEEILPEEDIVPCDGGTEECTGEGARSSMNKRIVNKVAKYYCNGCKRELELRM